MNIYVILLNNIKINYLKKFNNNTYYKIYLTCQTRKNFDVFSQND